MQRTGRLHKAALFLSAALLAGQAGAQGGNPMHVCASLGSVRIGIDRGSSFSPLPHELMERLDEARAACDAALVMDPKSRLLHAAMARVRALAGDAAGAAEAAHEGARLGSPNARVMLAVMAADRALAPRDFANAYEDFRRAARDSSPHASFNLGVLLANGWGVERHEADARAAFLAAANAGDALAMQVLGARYDTARAEEWLRKAAEAMYPEVPNEPLRIARRGAAELDGAALLSWYERRARAAEPWAQAYVGLLHEAGLWTPRDYPAALAWYRRAAEAGHLPAQQRLARLYREGRGVPRDLAEAKRWSERPQIQQCEALEAAEPGANPCDRLAADRYDPQRVVAGVDSYCMRRFAERAVAACSAALKGSPSTVRYRTQLARALAHTGRFSEARREAAAAAAAGSTTAMVLLGAMHQRGLDVAADPAAAAAWYAKAADAGDPRGMRLAGRQIVATAPSIEAQAEKGDPRAEHNHAAALEQAKRYEEAAAWYARAAAKGFRPAALNLAQMYEKGIGVKPDRAEARRRYLELARLGDGEARWRAGRLAVADGDIAEALELFRRSIRDDDYRAMLDAGEIYEKGNGVPRDVARAVALYERAAQHSPWARFKVGVLYLVGDGIPRDYAKARHWLERSAADGHAGARNNLGWMHDKGLGMPADPIAARDLYLAALERGNPQAKGNLEDLFEKGRGAPEGPASLDWYRAGAEAGIASAQYRVGRMYARGEHVARDDRVAFEWFLKAARQGHPGAVREAEARIRAAGHRPPEFPPPFDWPNGIATDAGADKAREIQFRVANFGMAYAVAGDAGATNVYDIIRWFPETDGRK